MSLLSAPVLITGFMKIDEGNTLKGNIHLWETRVDELKYRCPMTYNAYSLNENSLKEEVYKEFSGIFGSDKIMCGYSFAESKYKSFYFIRLFLSDEENAQFILKYNDSKILLYVDMEIDE
jgi:hypothetical protein